MTVIQGFSSPCPSRCSSTSVVALFKPSGLMDFAWILCSGVVMVIAGASSAPTCVGVPRGGPGGCRCRAPVYRIAGADPELEQSWQRYGACSSCSSGVALW